MFHNKGKKVQPGSTPSFIRTQHAFTQYIRDPKNAPRPTDIEERRMNMYRDFLFANISSTLSDGFPVLKKICTEQQWEDMCRDFFSRHQSHSPYFSEISQEFIQYIHNERANSAEAKNDFPFLLELAHYEWSELFVSIAEHETETAPISDSLNQILTIAPTAMALAYTYPVHKISPDVLPTQAPEQPTYLVVYRDADNFVTFLETTAITHALLTALTDNTEQQTSALLDQLAKDLQHPNPELIIQNGLSILEDFITRGIVIAQSA